MATQKPVRIIYQARSFLTQLTDVKAQVYLNGVPKAVGTQALTLTELDRTNSPGLYELVISAALLTQWGVLPTQYNVIEGYINSATAPAFSPFREELTVANVDDVDQRLNTTDTNIAAVKSDTAAIKVDLETGTYSLANLSAKLDKLAANSGFAITIPAQVTKPGSGTNSYRIWETLYNDTTDAVIDADGNTITVTLTNQAGADRSSYLTGYVAGTGGANGSAPMVRDSQGQYRIDLNIPSTAGQEELLFKFAYAVGGVSTVRTGATTVVTAAEAQGFALQTTLVDTQTRVTDVQTKVNDATFGLAAAQTLQSAIKAKTDLLTDGTFGLAALKALIAGVQTELTGNVEGTGFVTGTDSLHAISQYLSTNLISGGKAV